MRKRIKLSYIWQKKWLPRTAFADDSNGICVECCNKNITAEQESASHKHPRTASDEGVCRVRDVKKVYGHLCEIPIRAYCDAGVAWKRSDFVNAEDVERASGAWDARGIAHDIDTQWGDMPHGGAYKDSNHYYGPGCYDYY